MQALDFQAFHTLPGFLGRHLQPLRLKGSVALRLRTILNLKFLCEIAPNRYQCQLSQHPTDKMFKLSDLVSTADRKCVAVLDDGPWARQSLRRRISVLVAHYDLFGSLELWGNLQNSHFLLASTWFRAAAVVPVVYRRKVGTAVLKIRIHPHHVFSLKTVLKEHRNPQP